MEKALAEGPGAGTGFPSFASSFSSRVPAGQSLYAGKSVSGRAQRWSGGAAGFAGGEAGSAGAEAPARSGERKLLSLQVQEVFSQVLTHNNSEQGEELSLIHI